MEAAALVLNAAIIALTVPLIADPPYCVLVYRFSCTAGVTYVEAEPAKPNQNSAEEDQGGVVGSSV